MTVVVLIVIALMVLGLILMAAEVLVIPGFGVVGVLGGCAMVAACLLAYVELGSGPAALSLVAGAAVSGLLFWRLPKTRAAKSMVLDTAHQGHAADPTLATLQGKEGVAITDLRPAGTAKIDGRVVDVVTDGQYVERGNRIVVATIKGARVLVEPETQAPAQQAPAQQAPGGPEDNG